MALQAGFWTVSAHVAAPQAALSASEGDRSACSLECRHLPKNANTSVGSLGGKVSFSLVSDSLSPKHSDKPLSAAATSRFSGLPAQSSAPQEPGAIVSGQDFYLPFRPPTQSPSEEGLGKDEMLEILSDRRGLWHEYAPLISALKTSLGLTIRDIDEATGMTGVEQNKIVVAEQVYDNLRSAGLSDSYLSYYDGNGGADLLYELRVLSAQQRLAAARYVAEQELDEGRAREVARAVKEHERRRRDEGQAAFGVEPGDCLAFSFYRQSKETRGEHNVKRVLERGLEVAVSESAKQKLRQALGLEPAAQPEAAASEEPSAARIQVLRLSVGEGTFRPVAVLRGSLEDTQPEAVLSAPVAGLSGEFKLFEAEPGVSWTALPGWSALASAARPVGMLLPDVGLLPNSGAPRGGAGGPSPTLLIVERGDDVPLEDMSYYLVAGEGDQGVALQSGWHVMRGQFRVLGKVLLSLLAPLEEESQDVVPWE